MKRFLILLALLMFGTGIVVAQAGVDDAGNPNDPNDNDRANACYEGGTLEDKCDSEFMWAAGWYLIRFEYGLFDRSDVPAWLSWVLPPEPVIVDETGAIISGTSSPTTPTNCYTNGARSFYFESSTLNTSILYVAGYSDISCSGIVTLTSLFVWGNIEDVFGIITASNNSEAMTNCMALFSGAGMSNHSVQSLSSMGYNTPTNWYACAADSGPV